MSYTPPPEILERYADVLVNYALARGRGVKPGETVTVNGEVVTMPLFAAVCRAVWRAGGNVIADLLPPSDGAHNLQRIFFEEASDAQLDFFAADFSRGKIDQIDHLIAIIGDADPRAMESVDPQKLMRASNARQPAMRWRDEKERAGKFHWTLGLWGTEASAAEAGLSLEDYWQQIIKACFLDDADPIARWRETNARIEHYRAALSALPIDRLHVEADGTDLWFTLGVHRQWIGGSGHNVPSFEVFTSPDWRGTEGRIRFTEPLYAYGALAEGIELEFRDGLVTQVKAKQNQPLVEQIVAAPGGNRVGEFSLTDGSLSRIDHFMAETLYDENVGGPFGNTHLALGMSYTNTYDGDQASVTPEEWESLGYNNSAAVHVDIVATSDRTVTATLTDGSRRVIYADGHFQLD